MKIILEDDEAEMYIFSRKVYELEEFVNKLEKMHKGLVKCNRFELTDLCNKINDILAELDKNAVLVKLCQHSMSR